MNGNKVLTLPNGKPVTLRTGWNAITVKNSIRPSSNRNMLYDKLIAAGTALKLKQKKLLKVLVMFLLNVEGRN